MTITVRVRVLRPMNGDDGRGGTKAFEPGDYRTLKPADAERLESTGAVKIVSKPQRPKPKQEKKKRGAKPGAKAAPKLQNKKAPAPKNKSA